MFYNAIFALTILFPVFSCFCMDNALTRPASKITGEHQAPEKMVFSLSIPKDTDQYFVPKVEKLKMPENSRALIINMCKELKREKSAVVMNSNSVDSDHVLKNEIVSLTQENNNLKKECLEIKEGNTELSKKIEQERKNIAKNDTEISQEIFELQRQKSVLEKALLIKKIEQEIQAQESNKKKIAPAHQTKAIKPITTRQQPNSSAPITIKDYRFAVKTLMEQHKSKEQSDLFYKLIDICTDISHNRLKNNPDAGPYLNCKNHVLLGTVNYNFRYIYYPCTRKISILRATFSQLLTDTNKFMEEEKICSNACSCYKSKKLKFESISEDSSTDCSSHSSDIDTSSDHDLMPD
jgi:hypothetical protein